MNRTGDLRRWVRDRSLESTGRVAFQVKIRGSRFELGDFLSALRGCEGNREAVVLA